MDIIQNFLKQWMFFDIQTTCNLETWNMVMSLRFYHQYSFLCKNELDKYSNTKETIYSIIQSDLIVNGCDWHILAGTTRELYYIVSLERLHDQKPEIPIDLQITDVPAG